MLSYLLKRLALSVTVILAVLLILFSLLRMIPGNPATIALGPRATPEAIARYAEKMHLDEPLWSQFVIYTGNIMTGDLGIDVFTNREVATIIGEQIGFSLSLMLVSMGWAIALGIPLGCLAAVRPNSWIDRITGVLSVGTIAIPPFLLSIWALLVFSVNLRWLPAMGAGEPGNVSNQLMHLIMPAFAVGLGWVGYLARMVRASMLEVLGEPYIRSRFRPHAAQGGVRLCAAGRHPAHHHPDRHGLRRPDLGRGLRRDHLRQARRRKTHL